MNLGMTPQQTGPVLSGGAFLIVRVREDVRAYGTPTTRLFRLAALRLADI